MRPAAASPAPINPPRTRRHQRAGAHGDGDAGPRRRSPRNICEPVKPAAPRDAAAEPRSAGRGPPGCAALGPGGEQPRRGGPRGAGHRAARAVRAAMPHRTAHGTAQPCEPRTLAAARRRPSAPVRRRSSSPAGRGRRRPAVRPRRGAAVPGRAGLPAGRNPASPTTTPRTAAGASRGSGEPRRRQSDDRSRWSAAGRRQDGGGKPATARKTRWPAPAAAVSLPEAVPENAEVVPVNAASTWVLPSGVTVGR